jgi:Family of unknown function (DUF5681)
MTPPPKKPPARPYNIGYGKPPANTRFKKGVSGNPGGRPRGMTPGRALKLALQEIYRPVKIREGDRVTSLSGFQVVMRQLMTQAAKGNGPAGRMLIEQTFKLEQDLAREITDAEAKLPAEGSITNADRARALAAFVSKVKPTKQEP